MRKLAEVKQRFALATVGDMRWSASDGIVWFDDGDSALIADPAHQKPPVFLAYDNLGAWPEPIAQEDVAKLGRKLPTSRRHKSPRKKSPT
ncbi:hypothetical protein H0A66_02830 [Alcaligenaceae bacterium]|nr:hypothetical protein [Alcaligenaceae bacterium]